MLSKFLSLFKGVTSERRASNPLKFNILEVIKQIRDSAEVGADQGELASLSQKSSQQFEAMQTAERVKQKIEESKTGKTTDSDMAKSLEEAYDLFSGLRDLGLRNEKAKLRDFDGYNYIYAVVVISGTLLSFLGGKPSGGSFLNINSADVGIGATDLAAYIARWAFERAKGKGKIILLNVTEVKVNDFFNLDILRGMKIHRVNDIKARDFTLDPNAINLGSFRDVKELECRKLLSDRVLQIDCATDGFDREWFRTRVTIEHEIQILFSKAQAGDQVARAKIRNMRIARSRDIAKNGVLKKLYDMYDAKVREINQKASELYDSWDNISAKDLMFVKDAKTGGLTLRTELNFEGEASSPRQIYQTMYMEQLDNLELQGEKEKPKEARNMLVALVEVLVSSDKPGHMEALDTDQGIVLLSDNGSPMTGTNLVGIDGKYLYRAIVVNTKGTTLEHYIYASLSKSNNLSSLGFRGLLVMIDPSSQRWTFTDFQTSVERDALDKELTIRLRNR